MEYSIYKKTIQSPPKALSGYGSSFQSHSSLCSFNSKSNIIIYNDITKKRTDILDSLWWSIADMKYE